MSISPAIYFSFNNTPVTPYYDVGFMLLLQACTYSNRQDNKQKSEIRFVRLDTQLYHYIAVYTALQHAFLSRINNKQTRKQRTNKLREKLQS
jgi:hypothetical protein